MVVFGVVVGAGAAGKETFTKIRVNVVTTDNVIVTASRAAIVSILAIRLLAWHTFVASIFSGCSIRQTRNNTHTMITVQR